MIIDRSYQNKTERVHTDRNARIIPLLCILVIFTNFIYSLTLQYNLQTFMDSSQDLQKIIHFLFATLFFILLAFPFYLYFLICIKNHLEGYFISIVFLSLNILLIYSLYRNYVILFFLGLIIVFIIFYFIYGNKIYLTKISFRIAMTNIRRNFFSFVSNLVFPIGCSILTTSIFLTSSSVMLNLINKKDVASLAKSLVKNPKPLLGSLNFFFVCLSLFLSYLAFLYLSFLFSNLAYLYSAAYIWQFSLTNFLHRNLSSFLDEQRNKEKKGLSKIKEIFKLEKEEKESLIKGKDEKGAAENARHIAFDFSLGTCSLGTLFNPICAIFNFLMREKFYRKFALENSNVLSEFDSVSESDRNIKLNFYENMIDTIFPCISRKLIYYNSQSYLYNIRFGTDLSEGGSKSLVSFYENNFGEFYAFSVTSALFRITGILLTFVLSSGPAVLIYILTDENKFLLSLSIGFNTIFTVLPFISIVHSLVTGAADFVVQMIVEDPLVFNTVETEDCENF